MIICFVGKSGHGKSTAAQYLKSEIGATIIPFAKPLKKLAKQLGWDGVKDEKGRIILQNLGTEVCRNINPQYWINSWVKTYKRKHPIITVVDDLRFENEMVLMKTMHAHIIKIVKQQTWTQRCLNKFKKVHPSEKGFKNNKCDFIITAGSKEELELQLSIFIRDTLYQQP